MAIPPWATEVLRRGVGGVLERVPTDTVEQFKKRAGDLLAELPQTAARSVDSVMRSAKMGKDSVQRWTRRHIALVTPVVNGSGCLSHARIAGVPISDEAIDVAAEAMSAGALMTSTAHERLERRLMKCAGTTDYGILIATSVDAACLVTAHSLQRTAIYFHRSQSQRLPSGTPIPDAFAAGTALSGGQIHEVGSIDRVEPSDSRPVASPAALVSVENGELNRDWYHPPSEAEANQSNRIRIAYLPAASVSLNSPFQLPAPLQKLHTGTDIVITPGDGALGGPRCGLIFGTKKAIDAITQSSLWSSVAADAATQAAMTLTLEQLHSGSATDVPVQAMMHTSEDNLRSRAERLATRFAAEPTVATCQITDKAATFSAGGTWSCPSRQLRLTHRDLSAADWALKLLGEVPAVLVGVDAEAIIVDLRWIQPSDDASLVATLVGHAATTEA
jgi:L-seryl-tRNA(Ser) seleniumtransferase